LQIQTELELDEKKQVFLTLKQKIELNEEKNSCANKQKPELHKGWKNIISCAQTKTSG
jgi:hypothetical protein